MMIPSLRKPQPAGVRRFAASQSELPFTYSAVGATASRPPAGYTVDRTRVRLGEGEAVFLRAKAALERWEQFNLGWVKALSSDDSIRVGAIVGVMARSFGLWWHNACRVVYVIERADGSVTRFGFAYGTLPGHVEAGEERFLIEWDRASGEVCYDILAFSRPRHVLARLGYPLVRRLQKRFARDSAKAMVNAVAGAKPE